ncbi:MAG: UDP-N-acetylmuramoyl-tripeptide--D-alanyl-D-alanine ligase [Thermoleophilia bacterium]
MIELSLAEVARLAPGRLAAAPGADRVGGVEIDSRRVSPGDLFVAIRGGVAFVEAALAAGAAAAVVPDDPHAALAALGSAVRRRSRARIVAITGSMGKTTTKDVLAALCRPHVETVAAEGSHNNEIGLPLTLTRLTPTSEIAVVEMGMRGLGQIAELCAIAEPDVAVITNVGPVHLELLGTMERIAQAKAEILQGVRPGGTVIVPAGEPLLEAHLPADGVRVVRVGEGGDVSLRAFEPGSPNARLEVQAHGRTLELRLSVRSRHAALNALSAIAAYEALGLPLDRIGAGAADVRLSRWRDEEIPLADGGLLLADCYNANPQSIRAALAHLDSLAHGRRRVVVLGDMLELGPDAPSFHRQLGEEVVRTGAAVLVGVGELARHYLDGAERELRGASARPALDWAPDADVARDRVRAHLAPGDAILVKGSRGIRLETLVEAIAAGQE